MYTQLLSVGERDRLAVRARACTVPPEYNLTLEQASLIRTQHAGHGVGCLQQHVSPGAHRSAIAPYAETDCAADVSGWQSEGAPFEVDVSADAAGAGWAGPVSGTAA